MVSLSTYCTLGVLVAQAVKGGTHQLPGLDCVFSATRGHSEPAKQDSGVNSCAHPSDTADAGNISSSISSKDILTRNSVGEVIYTDDHLDPVPDLRTTVIGLIDNRDDEKRSSTHGAVRSIPNISKLSIAITGIQDIHPLTSGHSDTSLTGKRDVEDLGQITREIPGKNATILREIPKFSDNPLKDAFSVLGRREWMEGCLATSTEIVTNIFPREKIHGKVTSSSSVIFPSPISSKIYHAICG